MPMRHTHPVDDEDLGTTVLALQALQAVQHNAGELSSRTLSLNAYADGWPGNIAGAGIARQPATVGNAVRAASIGSSSQV